MTLSGTLSTPQGMSGMLSLSAGTDPTLSREGVAADAKAVGELKADIIEDTVSGPIANITDAKAGTVNSLEVAITPKQAGSGNPSPTNIRTISGWTGATIYHSGADTGDYETVTVSWNTEAGTVYGGKLNVTTGLLTVTHVRMDLGSINWDYAGGGQGRFQTATTPDGILDPSAGSVVGDIVCEVYPTKTAEAIYGGTVGIGINTNGKIWVHENPQGTDPAAFKTAVSGKYAVYRLANPTQTYQLTPTEVTTLLGENNIWADTGDVLNCEYKCDTKLYIQKLTMPTEDDMTANQNIASGKFFMIGNSLYYSTASIANGAKIIVGTNCNRVSLADALNNINS